MWSKIMNSDIGGDVMIKMMETSLPYHNLSHIFDCYDFLDENNVPYNRALDMAVAHHDCVYDQRPDKELRSAEWMLSRYPEEREASSIIMSTADHSIKGKKQRHVWMIKADLHQLTNPVRVMSNYLAIMHESTDLYNISEEEFARENIKFMNRLHFTIQENYDLTNDDFWLGVLVGIRMTKELSKTLEFNLGDAKKYGML